MKVKYFPAGEDTQVHWKYQNTSNGLQQNEFCTPADEGITDTDHKPLALGILRYPFWISQKKRGSEGRKRGPF